jgi:dihydrofolate reductase
MEGGTTFHFVTDGAESALNQAITAAGDDDVLIAGGASVIRQYLAAGLIDEFWLSVVSLFLGSGERPLDDLPARIEIDLEEVVAGPNVTHHKYALR